MSKHTPGEWAHRINKDETAYVVEAGHRLICKMSWHSASDFYPKQRQSEANARLLAAAPDLLAALVAVCDRSDELCKDRDAHRSPELEPLYQQCRAAIARATGEQP
jgi:hypothetical protein